jgi:histone deacetylase 11
VLAKLLEVPVLGRLPAWVTDRVVLRPMRWATAGTILAAGLAVEHGLAVNLSGGYHHAGPDRGHGFCAYADVALAVANLRRTGQLSADVRVAYVDLDAHQGDGVCHCFVDDRRVFIYDQYNRSIFPTDAAARRRVDCDAPLSYGCGEADYLDAVRARLPRFLDGIGPVGLAVYNAGTDVFAGDQLGGLRVSADGVPARDAFVLGELIGRRIPTVMVLSGGYSGDSFRMVAATVGHVLERWGGARPRRSQGRAGV